MKNNFSVNMIFYNFCKKIIFQLAHQPPAPGHERTGWRASAPDWPELAAWRAWRASAPGNLSIFSFLQFLRASAPSRRA
ncbi:MAG: hypothetical protein AAGK05_19645 [Pseudomonadota bacterium]